MNFMNTSFIILNLNDYFMHNKTLIQTRKCMPVSTTKTEAGEEGSLFSVSKIMVYNYFVD